MESPPQLYAKGLIATLKDKEFDELGFDEENLPARPQGTLGSMLVGDAGWIVNYPDYLDRHPFGAFQAENVIKVGRNRFWGYIGHNSYRSGASWEQFLREQYNTGLATKRSDKIPGFDGDVVFLDVPKITMRVFDLRKSKM